MNEKIFKLLTASLVVGGFAFGFQLANYKNSTEVSNAEKISATTEIENSVYEKTFAAGISTDEAAKSLTAEVGSDTVAPDPRVEAAIKFALEVAADRTHGYSQGAGIGSYTGSREGGLSESERPTNWTPDFDCSSLVYWALEKGGFKIIEQWQNNNPEFLSRYNGEQYTGDADTVWMDLEKLGGWTKYSWNEVKNDLHRGDILYITDRHIAFYIGNGQTVEARGVNNPRGGEYRTGDQGGEIDIYEAHGRGWNEVYRYVGK